MERMRTGVEVKNGVDPVLGADIDDAVEVLEALGLQNAGIHVVFEVGIIERQPDVVQPQTLKVRCVCIGEEELQVLG